MTAVGTPSKNLSLRQILRSDMKPQRTDNVRKSQSMQRQLPRPTEQFTQTKPNVVHNRTNSSVYANFNQAQTLNKLQLQTSVGNSRLISTNQNNSAYLGKQMDAELPCSAFF